MGTLARRVVTVAVAALVVTVATTSSVGGVAPAASPDACPAPANAQPPASPPAAHPTSRAAAQERVIEVIDTIAAVGGFAGMYFDNDCDGIPVFLTAGDPEVLEAVAARLLPSSPFAVRVVARSMGDLDALYAEVMAEWTSVGPMARVSSVGYDIRGNRVSVGVDGDLELVREHLSRFGDAVVVFEQAFPVSDEGPAASPSEPSAATPSAPAIRMPIILAPVSDPGLTPFEPTGPPDATARRHGVVVETWLSAPSAAPGDYVQVVVRATNTRSDPVWTVLGECDQPATVVDVDLSSIVRPGIQQQGRAAWFKRRAVRESGVMTASFDRWIPGRRSFGGIRTSAAAECAGVEGPAWVKLRPGGTLEERFVWYPGWATAGDRWQPLPPGIVPVTTTWYYAGHGRGFQRRRDTGPVTPIVATANLQLTGTDPGLPSFPELVDGALADPRFGDWVRSSSGWDHRWVNVDDWPGPSYPSHQHLESLAGKAPNGIVVLWLQKATPDGDVRPWFGEALVDPWTGEVVDVVIG